MNKAFINVLIILFVLVVFSGYSFAAIISADAYANIETALNAANPGDIVQLSAKVYKGENNGRNIDWPNKQYITLRGAGSNESIISAEALGRIISVEVAVDLTIEALTLKDGYLAADGKFGAGIYFTSSINVLYLKNVNLVNNRLTGLNSCGSAVWNYGGWVYADRCLFSNNATAAFGGVGAGNYGKWKMTNCIFSGNSAWGGGVFGAGAISSVEAINCVFYNNTITNFGSIIYGVRDFKALNTIFWGNNPSADMFNAVTYLSINYSDVQGGGGATGNKNVNPLFVNAAAGNFRLLATSECVNSGTFEGAPSVDMDGNPRPLPATFLNKLYFDMGCYEQAGGQLSDLVYVSTTGSNTTGVGTIDRPYQTIVFSLTKVATGGVVSAASGIYRERNISWPKKDNITLLGAGSNATIISGEALGRIISVESAVQLTIEALTLRNGSVSAALGGAIRLFAGSKLSLINCNISSNEAIGGSSASAGAVYTSLALAYSKGCTFNNNATTGFGGVFQGGGGTVEVSDCRFLYNKSSSGGSAFDAIIKLTISGCIFISNEASLNGGVINMSTGDISGCTFEGNSSQGNGGVDKDSILNISNCTYRNNRATGNGGVANNSICNIKNCIYENNSCQLNGGAVFWGGTLVITNCAFSNNQAPSGGVFLAGNNDIINCTFYNNQCTLFADVASGGVFRFKNCILWGNDDPFYNIVAGSSLGYCDLQVPDWSGFSVTKECILSDPMFINAAAGNFHLLSTSECVNSGTFEGAPTTDLDGNPRPLPANAQNKYYDIGCYEQAGLFGPTITVIQPNGGEVITAESYYPVKWNISGTVTTDAYVRLSTNGGLAWSLITREAGVLGISTYNWTVSNTPSTQCLISVEAGNPGGWSNDKSNGYFEIIPPPSAPTLEVIINGRRFVDGDVLPPNKSNMVSIKALGSGVVNMEMWLDGISVPLSALGGIPPVWVGTFIVTPDSSPAHILTFYAYSGGLGGTFVTLEAQVLTGSVQVVGVPLNYPNPFKPLSGGSTMIQYNLTDDANVTLILFDITGQEVKRIVFTAGGSGGKAGINMVEWDGKSMFGEVVGNGMYIYKITSGGRTIGTGKLVVRD